VRLAWRVRGHYGEFGEPRALRGKSDVQTLTTSSKAHDVGLRHCWADEILSLNCVREHCWQHHWRRRYELRCSDYGLDPCEDVRPRDRDRGGLRGHRRVTTY